MPTIEEIRERIKTLKEYPYDLHACFMLGAYEGLEMLIAENKNMSSEKLKWLTDSYEVWHHNHGN